MDDLFKTYKIKFGDRREFEDACELNNLADDIGYSDMIFTYSKKFMRDRFVGYLSTLGFASTIVD